MTDELNDQDLATFRAMIGEEIDVIMNDPMIPPQVDMLVYEGGFVADKQYDELDWGLSDVITWLQKFEDNKQVGETLYIRDIWEENGALCCEIRSVRKMTIEERAKWVAEYCYEQAGEISRLELIAKDNGVDLEG